MNKKYLFLLLLLQVATFSNSEEWIVPANQGSRLSTTLFNDSTRMAGMKQYQLSCLSCHGTPTKGNYQPLTPPPGDPATYKIQKNSDGEIFFKVSEGRGAMPSFKNILSSDEIWGVISYIRSFNKQYVQAVQPALHSAAYPGAQMSIVFLLNHSKDSLQVKIRAIKGSQIIPVAYAGLKVFIRRTFGKLPVDEEKTTNQEGIAWFALPIDLPADPSGKLLISAQLTNEELFGQVSHDTLIQAGIKTNPISLVGQRAMWNTVRKAPWWILFTFSVGVLAAWGCIFMVLLGLRDIYIAGKHLSSDV
jgi:mono/diheme cytochrome c family protein